MPRNNFENKACYDVLRVNKNSSTEDILKAFKKMCLETHPDKGGDDALQQMVNEAKDILTTKRREYDSYLECFKIRDGLGEATAKYFDKILSIILRYKPVTLELKKANVEIQQLNQVNKDLNDNLSSKINQLSQSKSDLKFSKEELTATKAKILELNQNVCQLNEENKKQDSEISLLKLKKFELEELASQLEIKNTQNIAQIQDITASNQGLQKDLKNANIGIQQQNKEIASY